MKAVVIVAARRTPWTRFRGPLANLSPVDFAAAAAAATLANVDRGRVDQLIVGNVLAAGHGMNLARQVGVRIGLPIATPAMTINLMCGSGMQAALTAVTAIRAGEANVVLAGGSESMSQAKLLVSRPGKGQQPDLADCTDSLQRDGLVDTFSDRHMGQQAEELAARFNISRAEQDAFAIRSQRLYATARAAGRFQDEIVPIGDTDADQHPRPDVTRGDLAGLKPVFLPDGSVTAGNSSGINDGAAFVLLAEREFALRQRWPILARWVDGVVIGCDPARMGLGPVPAIGELLRRSKTDWSQVDSLEINEAFAAQTLACLKSLGMTLDLSDPAAPLRTATGHSIALNACGGAIALGHPLAASGARLLAHLACRIGRGESRTAIGSLCIGGGMGIASLLTADSSSAAPA